MQAAESRAAASPTARLGHCLEYFRLHARRTPDKPFVILSIGSDRRIITYAQAWNQVLGVHQRLTAAGVPENGVALIFLPQGWEALAWYFGAIAHGCTASFMPLPSAKQDPDLYWASHDKLMARITPTAIITTAEHQAQIRDNGLLVDGCVLTSAEPIGAREAQDAAAADDAVARRLAERADRLPILQHSSGTTGLKKGVMLTNDAIITQVEAYADTIDASPDDVMVSWLPLYHDMGLVACSLTPMILGQTIVLLDPFEWVARPATLLDAISRHHGTLCWLPNFAFDHLSRSVDLTRTDARLDTIRAFINCSEPCQALSFRRFARTFAPIGLRETALQVCYAMAETTFAVTQTRLDRAPVTLSVDRIALHEQGVVIPSTESGAVIELLSNGTAIEGTTIEIQDADGTILPDGRVGEVCIRSTCLFSGYYRQPDVTADRLHGDQYHSRDRGFTWNGELYVLGRMDDLVIVAGRNFHAAEIETVLNGVAGLRPGRNVVFGHTNAERGTNDLIVVAETVDAADAVPAAEGYRALRQSVRHAIFQSLGIYPAEVRLVETGWLIKTTSGKIERGRNAIKFQQEKSHPAAREA